MTALKRSRRETHPIGSRYGWADDQLATRLGRVVESTEAEVALARGCLVRHNADDLAEALGLS